MNNIPSTEDRVISLEKELRDLRKLVEHLAMGGHVCMIDDKLATYGDTPQPSYKMVTYSSYPPTTSYVTK